MYVLKDAFSFDVHIANQDDYKYGKIFSLSIQ